MAPLLVSTQCGVSRPLEVPCQNLPPQLSEPDFHSGLTHLSATVLAKLMPLSGTVRSNSRSSSNESPSPQAGDTAHLLAPPVVSRSTQLSTWQVLAPAVPASSVPRGRPACALMAS